MRKRLLTMAAVLATIPLTPAVAVSPVAATPIEWTECGTTFKGECATIPVPIDWSNPTGPTFRLAIGRLKALDPARRIGVLFVHPGGPGNSGIDSYTIGRRIPDDSPLRQHFDIVTVDPRGVSRSNPVVCSAGLVAAAPTTFPANQSEYQALLEYNKKLAADCRKLTGPLFDHVDTISAVRDVDAIRSALGEQQITFYGASYGTQVGQQYAELFPKRIRAMTIDSNMDHSITSAYKYLKTTTDDQEQSFLEFASWCDRTPACVLHDRNAIKVWDELHAKAVAGKLVDPETGQPMGAEALRLEMFLGQFRPKDQWFGLASRLAALADHNAGRRASATPEAENPYPAIWCSDWRWDVNSFAQLDFYRRQVEAIAPHTKLSPFWSDVTICLGWPGPFNNPQHKLVITGTPTILITKSREDVGTPKAWTYAVAAQIPNSVLLEYDGVGHGNFRISKCARAHIETYLITLATPKPGTHCPPEYPTQPPSTTSTATADRPTH